MRKYIFPLLAVVAVMSYYSCTKDKASLPVAPGNCTANDTYNLRVKAIMDNYCNQPQGACHDATAGQMNVYLYDYATTKAAFTTTTPSLSPMCAIKDQGCVRMPYQLPALPDSVITHLDCWISAGYPQ